ncbi:diadenylate cyclase CdaA [Maledivibacter halophilus]|uniref:Diadenylate cyclase n=1 Tax=Maledivibacter halophilus TaxID=36842 RepID=A0A1T5I915_9FIRM|nr:diadenylate cyclase CdaA [Maledivibacter halophilus]SKC35548.1 diadenylate cyclase [Maledivibacter halophilus]
MEQLLEMVSNIGIRDIIDMTIVAFVFYKLYMLIRDTRAEQLIKGLLILLVATKLSEWSKLFVVNYILNKTITVGFIALLIVFQPELRKALEHLGRSRLLLTKNIVEIAHEDLDSRIKEISDAVASLSRQKIGALIILERETGISEVIETGNSIEGKISSSLLINIFIPNTPLHDGAVIIRKDKIMAAGCFLPLSENPNLSKKLGTRHRAALGITETSDALAIVVSEETGGISVAMAGKLSRFLDIDTLKTIIKEAFSPEKQNKLMNLKWRHKND